MYVFNDTCNIKDLSKIYQKFFGYPSKGTFVEVGSADGVFKSNTVGLINHGWRGIYIEPIAWMYESCKNNFFAKHSFFENFAIGRETKEVLFYQENIFSTSDLSRMDHFVNQKLCNPDNVKMELCKQTRLDVLFPKHKVEKNFELLVVDVNGSEEEVFESFDLNIYLPKVIVCSLKENHSKYQIDHFQTSHVNLRKKILSYNYNEAYVDVNTTIFSIIK